jgi:hypothetical protein
MGFTSIGAAAAFLGSAASYASTGLSIANAASAAPAMPKPAAPVAPPQAGQAPNVQGTGAGPNGLPAPGAGGQPGAAATFLTGGSGVDPATLSLGKSTLLGQ